MEEESGRSLLVAFFGARTWSCLGNLPPEDAVRKKERLGSSASVYVRV